MNQMLDIIPLNYYEEDADKLFMDESLILNEGFYFIVSHPVSPVTYEVFDQKIQVPTTDELCIYIDKDCTVGEFLSLTKEDGVRYHIIPAEDKEYQEIRAFAIQFSSIQLTVA